jgi:hypothetical protein
LLSVCLCTHPNFVYYEITFCILRAHFAVPPPLFLVFYAAHVVSRSVMRSPCSLSVFPLNFRFLSGSRPIKVKYANSSSQNLLFINSFLLSFFKIHLLTRGMIPVISAFLSLHAVITRFPEVSLMTPPTNIADAFSYTNGIHCVTSLLWYASCCVSICISQLVSLHDNFYNKTK